MSPRRRALTGQDEACLEADRLNRSPAPKPTRAKVLISIDVETLGALDALARANDLDRSQQVRALVREEVKRERRRGP